jgi:hypothetical protein
VIDQFSETNEAAQVSVDQGTETLDDQRPSTDSGTAQVCTDPGPERLDDRHSENDGTTQVSINPRPEGLEDQRSDIEGTLQSAPSSARGRRSISSEEELPRVSVDQGNQALDDKRQRIRWHCESSEREPHPVARMDFIAGTEALHHWVKEERLLRKANMELMHANG